MKYNFDTCIERKNTASFKWDKNKEFFNREDVIPMWVADMDFQCAKPIVESLRHRTEHPIFGYAIRTEGYYDAVIDWMERRHGYEVSRESLTFAPPGVIYAIYVMVEILTKEGDGIIMQDPNYEALFNVVKDSGRNLVRNKLKFEGKKYSIDFADLEEKIKSGAKVLILTNPNNPTGKVYKEWELRKIGELCRDNGVFVIVDEIYSDFIFKENKHIPYSSLGQEFLNNSMVCYSTNKGFNLGGLQMATVIIGNPDVREKFNKIMGIAQTRLDNTFGSIALEAAYTKCDDWLEQVIEYVDKNRNFLIEYVDKNISKLKVIESEGTFLAWIDCRELNMTTEELEEFLINKARLGLSQGYEYGEGGEGFVRMNIGCPHEILKTALEQLKTAINSL